MTTDGAELFWRIDTPRNLMTKGVVGMGKGERGQVNDEDWGIPKGNPISAIWPYQNTVSDVDSRIRYFTIDIGYDVLRQPSYKVAGFVGYNYFRQTMDALGCMFIMITPPAPCTSFGGPPAGAVVGEEDDTWKSLRIGTAVDLNLTSRLKVSGDVAYLPHVWFRGVDNHPFRTDGPSTFSPERGSGRGVQVETVLSYDLTDRFSVGVGARYWAMRVPDGEFNIFSTGRQLPMPFAVEQAALFVQGSLKFGADR
jgi:outer membrane protease